MTTPSSRAAEIVTKRQIGYEEAHQIAKRFIGWFFKNSDTERPRVCIPARPEHDDDLLLHSFIDQQAARTAELERERDELLQRLQDRGVAYLDMEQRAERAEAELAARAQQIEALVKEAKALKFGPYPAHGSGFVLIVTEGDIAKFKEALAAWEGQS